MNSTMAKSTTKAEPASKAARGAKPANDRKPKAERWEELLEAAAKVFHEKGYDAASLQDIASRVGILKGSIYYYIETKADLRNSVLLQVHKEGLEAIHKSASTDGNALVKLEAMIKGHIEYACRNIVKVTVYLQELKKLSPKERAALLGEQGYRDVFTHVIEEGQREGTLLSTLDPQLAAQVMLGSLNSVYQWYRASPGRPRSAIGDHFAATLLRGHAVPKAFDAYVKKYGKTW